MPAEFGIEKKNLKSFLRTRQRNEEFYDDEDFFQETLALFSFHR
jgi:hypothetical protein